MGNIINNYCTLPLPTGHFFIHVPGYNVTFINYENQRLFLICFSIQTLIIIFKYFRTGTWHDIGIQQQQYNLAVTLPLYIWLVKKNNLIFETNENTTIATFSHCYYYHYHYIVVCGPYYNKPVDVVVARYDFLLRVSGPCKALPLEPS